MDEDEEDVPTCPLCLEELDATDRAVRACQCGYQVCLLCLHTIREQLNQRCPACRTPYEEQNFQFEEVNPEQAAKEAKERKTAKKERERREKLKEIEKERARAIVLSQQKAKNNLKHARILQRNLVYVIGLSLTLAREEVIRRVDMFGKFGRMMRILVNRSHPFNADAPGGPSISAYVQYVRDSDAMSAVRTMNNAVFDGREIRCAIATTKYCDSLLRNAQASDPNATYHCGNTQCMYYHSTSHTETVLTKEEVLARQLGPPPPAHLFQPPANRRPHFVPHHRIPPAHLSAAPNLNPSTNRPLPNRPTINSPTLAHPPSNAPVIHPPSGPLPTSSFGLAVDQPSHSNILTTSPSPSSPTLLGSLSSRVPPFHHTPPVSPDVRQPPSRHSASPNPSDPASSSSALPSVAGPSSSTTAAAAAAAAAAASAANASAAWASTQPGHPITRTPTRRSPTPTDDPARSRTLTTLRRARADVPPGFEAATPSRAQSSAPSRPPGFEPPSSRDAIDEQSTPSNPIPTAKPSDSVSSPGPPVSSSAPDAAAESASNQYENGRSPSGAVSPPPGFGHTPKTRPNLQEEFTQAVAAAWSQEASSDQVFSGNDRRPTWAIGQVGTRTGTTPVSTPQPSPGGQADLAKVLATIGGSLGVSSEFRTMQPTSSQPFEPLGRRATPLTASPVAGSQSGAQPAPLGSLFGGLSTSQTLPSVASVAAPTEDIAGPSRFNTSSRSMESIRQTMAMGAIPPRIPPGHTRANMPPESRRKTSRFEFARKDPEVGISSVSRHTALPSPPMFDSLLNNAGGAGEGPFGVNSFSTETPSPMNESNGQSGNPSAARQTRSRFGFADQGSSPVRDEPGIEENVEIKLGLTHDGRMGQSGVTNIRDAFGESFAQLSTEEKLASIFTSARWATDALPPMPQFNSEVDQVMQQSASMSTSALRRDGHDVRAGAVGPAAAIGTGGRGQLATGGGTRSTRSRNIHPAPPGFRGATPGISPETTAADSASATTGVATKVVSGGTESKITEGESRLGVAPAEEAVSSGAESIEEDRKKSRAQRKRERRDRKAKQRVWNDRKASKDDENAEGVNRASAAETSNSRNEDVEDNSENLGTEIPAPVRNDVIEKALVASWTEPAISVDGVKEAWDDGDDSAKNGTEGEAEEKSSETVADAPHPVVESTVAVAATGAAESGGVKNATIEEEESHEESPESEESPSQAALPGIMSVEGSDGSMVLKMSDDPGKYMSVPELEREVEAARLREAQLQDKLMEITRRLRSYDNVRT